MKPSVHSSVKIALAFVLSVSFSSSSAMASTQDYYQYSNKTTMPVSRGTLQAAKITWQEAQVNHDINWLRSLQNISKNIFNQEMVVRASGGTTNKSSSSTVLTAPKTGAAVSSPSTVITDAALAAFVQTKLAGDNLLTRQDMIDIFRNVELDNWVTASEFAGLQALESNRTLYPQLDYVWSLSNNIVNGDLWNATYNGIALGNLVANVPGTFLESLVDKWFLGMDHSGSVDAWGDKLTYQLSVGALFVNGVSYSDINQGGVGDCWFLASLAEVALKDSASILRMFIDNGDNTYTVRLFNNSVADYFTVDKYVPVDEYGRLRFVNAYAYAADPGTELWTALAEKALVYSYASWYGAKNEYMSVPGNYMGTGLNMVTGYGTTYFTGWNSGTGMTLADFNSLVTAYKAGAMICLASKTSGGASNIVANHAYSVIGYNALNQTFTLFNPWGLRSYYGVPAILTLTWSQIQTSFAYFDYVKK